MERIDEEEVRAQLKKMASGKAADKGGVVAEMLKHGGEVLVELLTELFNDVLEEGRPLPEYWKEMRLTVLFKKGDIQCLDNYRPVAIIPIMYKLFSRILDVRIRDKIAGQQSVDQAAFRPGFGCEDHLFVMSQLREKCAEWNINIWVAAVDFKKAFDCVEHDALWKALEELGAPGRYIDVLQRLYAEQSATVRAEKESKRFTIGRGTKQGDPVSPILFNTVVEVFMRKLKKKWDTRRQGFDLEYGEPRRLQNLRFADDILLLGGTLGQVTSMLADLSAEAKAVGLEIHFGKTKILSNVVDRKGPSRAREVEVAGQKVEVLQPGESVAYLGRCLCFEDAEDREVEHRIGRGWAKFAVFKGELCDRRYSLLHRLKLFNAVISPTVLYGAGTWTMTVAREKRLRAAQRLMLRKMLRIGRQAKETGGGKETERGGADDKEDDGGSSNATSTTESSDGGEHGADDEEGEAGEEEEKKEEETWVEWMIRTAEVAACAMQKAKIPDWVQEQRRRKWRWAGHVVRRRDMRWSTRMLFWEPLQRGSRPVGRPAARWEDSLNRFARDRNFKWTKLAEDRGAWQELEDAFVDFKL